MQRTEGIPPILWGRVPGFTLIELLVAMSILLILATITIRLVNTTLDSDRMKTGRANCSRIWLGSRPRHLRGQPRGVRFIPDQTDPFTVRSFVYVGAPTSFTDGTTINISATGADYLQRVSHPANVGQSLEPRPARQRVPNPADERFDRFTLLSHRVADSRPGKWCNRSSAVHDHNRPRLGNVPDYIDQLSITTRRVVLSGEHLARCREISSSICATCTLPTSWPSPSASSTFDVLFSPGTVVGPPPRWPYPFRPGRHRGHDRRIQIGSLTSRLGFQLNAPWQATTAYQPGNIIVPNPSSFIGFRCTQVSGTGLSGGSAPSWPSQPNQTVTDNQVTWQSFVKKANLIVSLATATGRVTTHPVDVSPNDTLTIGTVSGYDSFKFAEIGEVTQ